ncbi:WD40 repeat domain-containing protein [Microbacterium indicum]|uniref:WD40 repeat domain-containing protein n=1 Tax=Microbacterium indicum TaxID=358100 RepID=UPI000403B552|nr:WD40 repeat domain-containing protein [Microbacterium indicum]
MELIRNFGPAYHSSLSPDGRRLLRERQSKAYIHDVASGEEIGVIPTGSNGSCAALLADGSLLADRSHSSTRRVFDVADGSVRWKGRPKGKLYRSHEKDLVLAVDGTTLLEPIKLASGTTRIDLVDGLTGEVAMFERPSSRILDLRPAIGEDRLLLLEELASREHLLSWFDPRTGESETIPIDLSQLPHGPARALWDPHARAVIIAGLWDHVVHTGTGRQIDDLSSTPALSPDGHLLAAGGNEGRIRILDAHTFEVRDEFPAEGLVHNPTFTPDGKELLITAENRAHLYRLDAV